jgi:hypothetical protein
LGIAELDLAAIRVHLERPLAFYYIARTVDSVGVGRVQQSEIHGGLSRSGLWRILRAGDGIFWTRHGDTIYLRNPAKVAQALSVQRLRTPYSGPVTWLLQSSGRIRARLGLNALALIRDGKPTSLVVMGNVLNISSRSVSRWLRMTRFKRIVNVALVTPVRDTIPKDAPRTSRDGRVVVVPFKGQIWLGHRMPNSLAGGGVKLRRRAALRRWRQRMLLPCDFRGRGQQRYLTGTSRRRARLLSPAYQRVGAVESIEVWTQV